MPQINNISMGKQISHFILIAAFFVSCGGGNNDEVAVVATGTEQTVVLDLSAMTVEQRSGLNLFVVFAQTVGQEGVLIIHSWAPVETVSGE